jgi:hypothetical protein
MDSDAFRAVNKAKSLVILARMSAGLWPIHCLKGTFRALILLSADENQK